jgi:hypothetical protein
MEVWVGMHNDDSQRDTDKEGSNGTGAGDKTTGKPRLNVALVDVHPGHREALRQACLAAGCSPVFRTLPDTSSGGLGRWADLLVVECDRGFRALHTAERARRAGTCPIGVLVHWWSDLEWEARQAAHFVLHVPLAPDEVREVLAFTRSGQTENALASALPAAT